MVEWGQVLVQVMVEWGQVLVQVMAEWDQVLVQVMVEWDQVLVQVMVEWDQVMAMVMAPVMVEWDQVMAMAMARVMVEWDQAMAMAMARVMVEWDQVTVMVQEVKFQLSFRGALVQEGKDQLSWLKKASTLWRYLTMSAALRRRSGESTTIWLALGRRRCTTASTIASTTLRIRGTFGSTASSRASSPSNAMTPRSLHLLAITIQLQTQ